MRYIFQLLLILLPLLVSNQIAKKEIPVALEIPAVKPGEKVTKHLAYSLLFDKNFHQARWVAYELTEEETKKSFERSDKFTADPLINCNTSFQADYSKSGYDRGHLAPAADMSWCDQAVRESFYYSNMSPQLPAFNRGIWKKLETKVREWAIENKVLYVVTGPVLETGLPCIGPDHISVPKYYYKVLLDYTEPQYKAIGFLLFNEGSTRELDVFAVAIDSVEKITGLDFFPLLPDSLETQLESECNFTDWDNINPS